MKDFQSTPAVRLLPSDFVAEYLRKSEAAPAAIAAFEQAQIDVRLAASVGGTHSGDRTLAVVSVTPREFADTLLKSSWRHIYAYLKIGSIATANDKKRLETFMASPPDFTIDNIVKHLGDYLIDQRGHALRGLAECFVNLDPAYKSHSKVRIGVKGLPKRVILSNCMGFDGRDRMRDIFSAIAKVDDRPGIDISDLIDLRDLAAKEGQATYRDMTIKAFANGNAHLHFGPDSLRTINGGLAEYYGEVLPDAPDENATKAQSKDLSKNLAFYPTPPAVVDYVFSKKLELRAGDTVLEPSCGDGAFLDRLAIKGHKAFGIEVDPSRAEMCRRKGHDVLIANFLTAEPHTLFDWVVMNPPFEGRHYLKHIRHAIDWLKPGGKIVAILPATAWYDHGELPDDNTCRWDTWRDLPVGSFASSGTNVPTGVWTYAKATA